jgi:hypothetical protein
MNSSHQNYEAGTADWTTIQRCPLLSEPTLARWFPRLSRTNSKKPKGDESVTCDVSVMCYRFKCLTQRIETNRLIIFLRELSFEFSSSATYEIDVYFSEITGGNTGIDGR